MRIAGNERGLTLVEFTIVAALGAMVVLTISSFYLTAQSMWLDSSIQAVSQRDATMFANEIGKRIEASDTVDLPDPHTLLLYRNSVQTGSIIWEPGDNFADVTDIVDGESNTNQWPPNGRLKSLRFRVEGPDPRIVYMDSLRIETAASEMIYLSSAYGLYNHP